MPPKGGNLMHERGSRERIWTSLVDGPTIELDGVPMRTEQAYQDNPSLKSGCGWRLDKMASSSG